MSSLVFSFQWNIISNSFIIRTYYVSEIGNNFHRTNPPPAALPPEKTKLALSKTPPVRACGTSKPFDVR